ncbi:MAG TPA: methylmalonyl Co-A mutase-associated GTPase MeaB [Dehalococcoidia bacterium]|nr:methylmalonyl Co-A mutase-associated GTPase MeaB [Dehalococcoidia bacterium]
MVEELVRRLVEGDRRALARVISLVEADAPEGHEAVRLLYTRTGRAHTIGITGSAGTGKSTLTAALARAYRAKGKTVGIVAVDPSSPFTHGALLGDRIRMQDLSSDPGVFVRSMASRDALGGLAPATADVVSVLDAAGKDIVIIETVGAGQDEVEVASAAMTTVVLLTPGAGDDVQAMKAGIMEIADVLVVHKADLPNADQLLRQVASMVEGTTRDGWRVPVLKASSAKGDGIDELVEALERHRQWLVESGALERQRASQARHQVLTLVRHRLLERVLASTDDRSLDEVVRRVAARDLDPHTAAETLIAQSERLAAH